LDFREDYNYLSNIFTLYDRSVVEPTQVLFPDKCPDHINPTQY